MTVHYDTEENTMKSNVTPKSIMLVLILVITVFSTSTYSQTVQKDSMPGARSKELGFLFLTPGNSSDYPCGFSFSYTTYSSNRTAIRWRTVSDDIRLRDKKPAPFSRCGPVYEQTSFLSIRLFHLDHPNGLRYAARFETDPVVTGCEVQSPRCEVKSA